MLQYQNIMNILIYQNYPKPAKCLTSINWVNIVAENIEA